MEHICHALGRMVNIALEIHESRALFQDSVFISLFYGISHFVHISISFSDVHIVPDSDHVCHEGDHVGCLPHSFTVSDLGFSFIQILNFKSE